MREKAGILIIDTVNGYQHRQLMQMLIKKHYKNNCLQVFYRIAVLKNSKGSKENTDGGGLQVFRKAFLINIYDKFIFLANTTE